MRITTHREQFAMTNPWLREALDLAPGVGTPGRGMPNPGYGQQPPVPRAPIADAPWQHTDWRTAQDYGHFNSTSRPPMSSDIPHPSQTLDPNNPEHVKPRVYSVKQKDDSVVKYHLPSRIDSAANSADPDRDPYGVMTPYTKVEHHGADGTVRDISHEFHLGNGNTAEGLANNNLDHYNAQTPEQAHVGKHWYRAAHEGTKDLSDHTIGDHAKTVHTMSAFSPKTQWDENLEKGHHFLTQYGGDPNNPPVIPGLQSPVRKALDIYHSKDDSYLDANSGPKTKAFANNILDDTPMRAPRPGHDEDSGYYDHPVNPHTGEPDWRMNPDQDQTVDTHDVRMKNTPHGDAEALRALKYGTPPHFEDSFMSNGQRIRPGYDLYARMGAEATQRANLAEPDAARHIIPKQMQAGPWGKFKNDLDVATNNTAPEPGQRPKSLTDKFKMKKNLDRPQQDVEDEWAQKSPLSDTAIPRYQRDSGDWIDPRRPKFHAPDAQGLYKRLPKRSSVGGQGAWDQMLGEYLSRHPIHGDADLAAAAQAHLGAFYDPFEFSHAEGPHNNPWSGAEAEALQQGCKYCGAGPGDPHDVACPTHASDDPRDWEMDHAALDGPSMKPSTNIHLNSVASTLRMVDDLLGGI